jgi:hypothetical protein
MEASSLESVNEIFKCDGLSSGGWPNIPGAKFDGTVDGPSELKKYSYTFNNLRNKKVSFCVELIGREFEFLQRFKIIKITTKK